MNETAWPDVEQPELAMPPQRTGVDGEARGAGGAAADMRRPAWSPGGSHAARAGRVDPARDPAAPAGRDSLRAMTARTLARLQALGRLGIGARAGRRARRRRRRAGSAAPRTSATGRTLAIGLGGRDVALALGTLRALAAGHGARPWLRAGMRRRRGRPRRPRCAPATGCRRSPCRPSSRSPAARSCSAPGSRPPPTERRLALRRRARATRSCAACARRPRGRPAGSRPSDSVR